MEEVVVVVVLVRVEEVASSSLALSATAKRSFFREQARKCHRKAVESGIHLIYFKFDDIEE
jgi:hypothetical protein